MTGKVIKLKNEKTEDAHIIDGIIKLLSQKHEETDIKGIMVFAVDDKERLMCLSGNATRCDLLGYAQSQLTGEFLELYRGLNEASTYMPLPSVED